MEVCLQRSLVDGGSKPRPAPPSVGADVCEVQKPLSLLLTEAELGQRPQGHWVCVCVCVCVCWVSSAAYSRQLSADLGSKH